MIYIANALVNTKLALKLYEYLTENNVKSFLPIQDIELNGKTINIAAFDQIRKRDPKNPYLIEMKKKLLEIQKENIEKSVIVILCIGPNEKINSQTYFELVLANYLKKPIFSTNPISTLIGDFYEEVLTYNIIPIQFEQGLIEYRKEKLKRSKKLKLKTVTNGQ